jgi:hypothetical protein
MVLGKLIPTWTPINIKVITKKKMRTAMLILATFFNPLGFDALFALVMKWTGSYWVTDIIFYSISALFFGLYYLWKPKSNEVVNKKEVTT